ncbi:MAG: 3-dehydro-L-gulonate 2-dehydrogenase [Gemmatimonadaceae bacterium]|nr:3-dehydro-L-gulonate 2-dehydrogenase [Chitinophagaceae bacterium]
MIVSVKVLKEYFEKILIANQFSATKAAVCAEIFSANTRDGVHSHGVNRFPVFVKNIAEGLISPGAEPELSGMTGMVEHWDGQLGAGMYNASVCMERATVLAKKNGIGLVTLKNTNHWMRGGYYGWQAAHLGCMAICCSNTIANMPPWGGVDPTLGNNPLVIAVPREDGHVVLDMAMSQFSYGKLQSYELEGKPLPVPGGYDEAGLLSNDPKAISKTLRTLPAGFWKGSGLSLLLDMLVTGLSGGRSVGEITSDGNEYGVSQFFLCFDAKNVSSDIVDKIIEYTRSSDSVDDSAIRLPGDGMEKRRMVADENGVDVNDEIWNQILSLHHSAF